MEYICRGELEIDHSTPAPTATVESDNMGEVYY